MSKRQWLSLLFIVAFVISLAHASIPHIHPELENDSKGDEYDSHEVTGKHHSGNQHRDNHGKPKSSQQKDHHDHKSHHHSTEEKPKFSHFSNADYLGNCTFKFTTKEKFLLDVFEHERLVIDIPIEFQRALLFPRARDIPRDKHRCSQSLRAPPFLS